jgi:hypothetical protein
LNFIGDGVGEKFQNHEQPMPLEPVSGVVGDNAEE